MAMRAAGASIQAISQQDSSAHVTEATEHLAVFNFQPKFSSDDSEIDDGEVHAVRTTRELRVRDLVVFYEAPYVFGELTAMTWGMITAIKTSFDEDGDIIDASVTLHTLEALSYNSHKVAV